MKIYVVRHCTTECSAKKIYCGSSDVPLSEEGRREARRLGIQTQGYEFEAIFSSPLLRARETAAAIAGERNIPVFYDDRLKERAFGTFEQTSAERADGRVFRYHFAMKYPDGESYLQVAARIYAFLDEICGKYDGNLFVVSHGSACRIIRTYFMDMTDEEFFRYSQPNGSIKEYELRK